MPLTAKPVDGSEPDTIVEAAREDGWYRDGRLYAVLGLIAVGALACVLFRYDPATSGVYPPCLFRWLTGLECPGCGSGRALHAIVHGDVLQAIAFNVLVVCYVPFLVYSGVRGLRVAFARRPLPPRRMEPVWLIWAHFWMICAFWILRNVPIYPFTLLAPHQL